MREGELKFSVYRGDWVNDLPKGKGTFYNHSTSTLMHGPFSDLGITDTMSSGADFRLHYPTGDTYEGQLYRNQRHGRGRLFYANGDQYDGSWLGDRRNGSGRLTVQAESVTIDGLFSEDQVVEGRMTDRYENVF